MKAAFFHLLITVFLLVGAPIALAEEAPLSEIEFLRQMKAISQTIDRVDAELQRAQIISRANGTRLKEAQEDLEKARGGDAISLALSHLMTRQAWIDTTEIQLKRLEKLKALFTAELALWQRSAPFMLRGENYRDAVGVRRDLVARVRDLENDLDEVQGQLKNVQKIKVNLEKDLADTKEKPAVKKAMKSNLNALTRREKYWDEQTKDIAASFSADRRLLSSLNTELTRPTFKVIVARASYAVYRVWRYELFTVSGSSITVGKVALAVIIVSGGFFLAKLLTYLFGFLILSRITVQDGAAVTFKKIFFYLVVVATGLLALKIVEIPLTMFAFLGGAFALALGFGAQNLLNNFISGLIIMFERPVRVGDLIEIEGNLGRVTNIGARCSQITQGNGVEVLVPNSTILEKNVVNWTLSNHELRIVIKLGVAYGSPLSKVAGILKQAALDHGKVLKQPEPVVLFSDFGDNALQFDLRFWISLSGGTDSAVVASDIRHEIDRKFRENEISVPFPQRDMNLVTTKPLDVHISREA